MSRRTIACVVGTRPNFMKTAPVMAELSRRADRFAPVLIHTGQHYDRAMSEAFLEDLGLGEPDHFLGVGSGSHAAQTARTMERLEPVLAGVAPDLVLVPGDVNSTLAAAVVASKMDIPVGHIESGLRSFDRTMPEELNRLITDQLSDLLFTHSPEAEVNLLREGRPADAIHLVGNTMIDTLVAMRDRIAAIDAPGEHGLPAGGYLVVTLHRPALVDGPLLAEVMQELERLAAHTPVVFPVHPRTRAAIGDGPGPDGVRLLEPLGYMEFLSLVGGAAGVLTDSGGIQEETTFLGVPCFTLRDNTERPITCEQGTNVLLGLEPSKIGDIPSLLESASRHSASVPPLWDGVAASRIADILDKWLAGGQRAPAAAAVP